MAENEITAARTRGIEDAKAAAAWAADGNTSPEHARRVLAMLADGDPEAFDLLPPMPTLSGEWADDLTPLALARDVTGEDEPDGWTVGLLADEYERGVSDTFALACEEALRAALPEPEVEQRAAMACRIDGREFRWSGGEYIDVGYVSSGELVPSMRGEFVADDCINVWDYEHGEPTIDRTLAAFERRCIEFAREVVA